MQLALLGLCARLAAPPNTPQRNAALEELDAWLEQVCLAWRGLCGQRFACGRAARGGGPRWAAHLRPSLVSKLQTGARQAT